jgi:hypothetical protein
MDVRCGQSISTSGNDRCPGGHQRVSFVGGEGVSVRVEMGNVVDHAFDDLPGGKIGLGKRKRGKRRRCFSSCAGRAHR